MLPSTHFTYCSRILKHKLYQNIIIPFPFTQNCNCHHTTNCLQKRAKTPITKDWPNLLLCWFLAILPSEDGHKIACLLTKNAPKAIENLAISRVANWLSFVPRVPFWIAINWMGGCPRWQIMEEFGCLEVNGMGHREGFLSGPKPLTKKAFP